MCSLLFADEPVHVDDDEAYRNRIEKVAHLLLGDDEGPIVPSHPV